ncbi:hypothetical protein Tco_0902651 [Tanacetum coccineum]
MMEKSKLDEDTQGKAVDPTYYRGMIGTLMYLTTRDSGIQKILLLPLTAYAEQSCGVAKILDVKYIGMYANYWETELFGGHPKKEDREQEEMHYDIQYDS